MEQPKAAEFQRASTGGIALAQVIATAKENVTAISGSPVDAVAKCERVDDAHWLVVVDVVESAARMGENDLLAAYEVKIAENGQLASIERRGRYRREDDAIT